MRGLLIVILIGAAAYMIFKPAAVNTATADLCQSKSAALASVYDHSTQTGLLKSAGSSYFGSNFEVNEWAWATLAHDAKIALALSAYCHIGGRGTMVLSGLHDGQTKASIVNGNYSD